MSSRSSLQGNNTPQYDLQNGPEIIIHGPSEGRVYGVNASFSAMVVGADQVEMFLNGEPVPLIIAWSELEPPGTPSKAHFSVDLNLALKLNTVEIVATSADGDVSRATRIILASNEAINRQERPSVQIETGIEITGGRLYQPLMHWDLDVTTKNTTESDIIGIRVLVRLYDAFGEPVLRGGMMPPYITQVLYDPIDADGENTFTLNLMGYDNPYRADVILTSFVTSDGTITDIPESQWVLETIIRD